MIARASQLFLPTLRDAPADAEAASHQLLVRGGFIRQMGAGLWSFLPLGWRVHMRSRADHPRGDRRDRRPGDALPDAHAGRALGDDRADRRPDLLPPQGQRRPPFVLSWTHEESMTFLGREIQSYKQLPQIWYHFSTKDRDEPRPRGGLLRVREFIMKDSYSFDVDEAGLDASFKKHEEAYEAHLRALRARGVLGEAESGTMGGKESPGFLAPTGLRRERARCAARTATTSPTPRLLAVCHSRAELSGALDGAGAQSRRPASGRSRRSRRSSGSRRRHRPRRFRS